MPGPSDAQMAVEEFRARMAVREAQASAQVIRAYAPVHTRLQSDTRALVQIAQTRGLKPWQVMRMERLKELERQFLVNADRFAKQAGTIVTESQRAAVGLARQGALEAATAGLPRGVTMDNMASMGLGWNRLPDDAFDSFVGIAGDGAPLANLLEPLGPQAITGVREKIGEGIALGKGPRETAKLVTTAAGIPLSRALLITRTETNRAFREATRLNYSTNSRVVKGYRRHADHSERTCVACISLDGKFYTLDEALDEHPNGRCALVPEVLDYADLGLDMPREGRPENARDWLTRQGSEVQRRVLGGTRFDAWKAGEIELNQLAVVRPNRIWGDTAVVRPLNEIATRSGTPIRQVGAPPSALKPPPPPAPGRKPPPQPGELVDPQTGLPVRGSRTTPPEPVLPKEWDVNATGRFAKGGDPDDFLDIAPGEAMNLRKYSGTTSREAMITQVKEQEAWARAVGGAVEVDYSGLSIKAARDVNQAVARTIVKDNAHPLERIVTYPKAGSPFDNAYAYQTHQGGVHINAAGANGSARTVTAKTSADNARNAQQQLGWPNMRAGVVDDIAQKKIAMQEMSAERVALRAEGRDAFPISQDMKRLRKTISEKEQTLKDLDKMIKETRSGAWSTANSWDEIITHEIGHYYHRRYGFYDPNALSVLSKKHSRDPLGFMRKYDPEDGQWKGAFLARDEAYKLSKYAGTNDHEFFAEAFAEYHFKNKNISPRIRKFVEEVKQANTEFGNVDLRDAARIPLGERKGNPKSVFSGRFPVPE